MNVANQKPTWLLDHRSNVHSQAGEDGVIGKVLELLPCRDRWCVEFGAWDGRHLSNTANLIENAGYAAVLIEASAARYSELERRFRGNDHVITLNRLVGYTADDCLDHILADTPIPTDFDVLSIDIDGNDYFVWKAISRYRPKVVCIEFNPTIPTDVQFVQPADPNVNQGASVSALAELGKEKGYELVAVLPHNALFVRDDFFSLFGISDNRPSTLRLDTNLVTHIFSGYDGTVLLTGCGQLPWHGLPITGRRVQVLPRYLRRYPESYGSMRHAALRVYRFASRALDTVLGLLQSSR